jgi:hypothetical protein
VTKSLASKRSDAVRAVTRATAAGVGALVACGAPRSGAITADRASIVALADEPDAAPRRPDGVVLEPPTAMPSASARAEARGVVALRQPIPVEAVNEVVRALVDAWAHESLDGLFALLTQDAGPLDARARGRAALMEGWRQRLRAREYKKLEGLELYRPDRIERYLYEDLGGPDEPSRPADMRPDDVYVRVPLEVSQLGGERYFEGVLVLLLRLDQGHLKIAGYGETGGT